MIYRRDSKLDPFYLLREAETIAFPTNRGKLLAELEEIRAELVVDLHGITRAIAVHEATASSSGDAEH